MSALHQTLRDRLRAWFHPSADALRRMKRLGESIGFAKGLEAAGNRIPPQWRPKVIQDVSVSDQEEAEWEAYFDKPAESHIQQVARQAWESCKTGARPGEYVRLANKLLHEHDAAPIKRNPLVRAVDRVMQPPQDDSWLIAPMPERVPVVPHVDIWEDVEELASKSGLLPALDDDNAPTAYGRAIMLDKVARRAHQSQPENEQEAS